MPRPAWVAFVLALAMAVAPALGTLHQALVRHVVCEHGDLIESGERSPSLDRTAPPAPGSKVPSLRPDTEAARHTHDHCVVGTLAKTAATVGALRALAPSLQELPAQSEPCYQVERVGSVLRNAPKTSPPAVMA